MVQNKALVFKEWLINKTPAFIVRLMIKALGFIEWVITKIENSMDVVMGVVLKLVIMVLIIFVWTLSAIFIWIVITRLLPELLSYI